MHCGLHDACRCRFRPTAAVGLTAVRYPQPQLRHCWNASSNCHQRRLSPWSGHITSSKGILACSTGGAAEGTSGLGDDGNLRKDDDISASEPVSSAPPSSPPPPPPEATAAAAAASSVAWGPQGAELPPLILGSAIQERMAKLRALDQYRALIGEVTARAVAAAAEAAAAEAAQRKRRGSGRRRAAAAATTATAGCDDSSLLLRGALLIARHRYPSMDESQVYGMLDEIARRVAALLPADPAERYPLRVVAAINRVMYTDFGFRGNEEDYYNADNSCINRVLERRVGIPITLSLVYAEVARRVGLRVRGLNLPGHFMLQPLRPLRHHHHHQQQQQQQPEVGRPAVPASASPPPSSSPSPGDKVEDGGAGDDPMVARSSRAGGGGERRQQLLGREWVGGGGGASEPNTASGGGGVGGGGDDEGGSGSGEKSGGSGSGTGRGAAASAVKGQPEGGKAAAEGGGGEEGKEGEEEDEDEEGAPLEVLIDAFRCGEVCYPAEAEERLSAVLGSPVRIDSRVLRESQPLPPRLFLLRMLGNLRSIYLSTQQVDMLLDVLKLMRATLSREGRSEGTEEGEGEEGASPRGGGAQASPPFRSPSPSPSSPSPSSSPSPLLSPFDIDPAAAASASAALARDEGLCYFALRRYPECLEALKEYLATAERLPVWTPPRPPSSLQAHPCRPRRPRRYRR